jgi:hypothetical protein
VVIPCYEHEGTGGPDAFGYSYIDNSEPGGPVFNWIEISGTGTQVEPTSHYFMSDEISIGFPMEFYGMTHTSIWINSHGELHLGTRDSWLGGNDCPLPDASTPHAALLAVFWDMLYIHYEEGLGVYYQYFDDGNNDYFVVEWQAKIGNASSDTVVFEAILYENGEIIYQYNYVNDEPEGQGQAATIGMEYDVLPSGISYNCDDANPANRLTNGLAIKWFVGGGSACDYVVGDINDSGGLNGLDVTYGVAYFKGGPPPPYQCECTPGNTWYVSGDANASCSFNGLDITYLVSYFKGGATPIPCGDCPPPSN